MIEWLNANGTTWWGVFVNFELQNSIFIILVFILLLMFKLHEARFKKQLIVIGLFKTLIPPILTFPAIGIATSLSATLPITIFYPQPISATSATTHAGLSLYGLFFLFRLTGTGVVLLISVYGMLKYRGQIRKAKSIHITDALLPAHTSVYVSKAVKSPMVFGMFKHKILLPQTYQHNKSAMKRSILMHEISHIRNGDLYLNGIKILSLAIHFFNPLQWLLIHYFELFTEMACDDRTIKESGLERIVYNNYVLKAAEAITFPAYVSKGWGFSRAFRLLKKRITYQLSQKENNIMKRSNFLHAAVISVLFIAIIPLSWRCSNEQKEKPNVISVSPQQENSIVDANGVYAYYAVDKKPVMLKKTRPVYPEIARKAGIQGLVILTVTIDENGKVIDAVPLSKPLPAIDANGKIIEMRAATLYPQLEPAAIEAAKKCIFKPAERNGQAVKVRMNVPFRFRLN